MVAAGTDLVVLVSWSGSTGFATRMVIAVAAFRWEPTERELRAAVLWLRAVPVTPASNREHADVAPVALVGSVVPPVGKLADGEVAEVAESSAAVPRLVRGQPVRLLVQPPAAPVGAARVVVPAAAAVVAPVAPVAPVVVAVEIVVAASRRASWAAVVEVDAEPAIPFASRSVHLILSSSLVGLVLAVPGRLPCGLAASAACSVRRSAAPLRG